MVFIILQFIDLSITSKQNLACVVYVEIICRFFNLFNNNQNGL